jgi:hypothetical protein
MNSAVSTTFIETKNPTEYRRVFLFVNFEMLLRDHFLFAFCIAWENQSLLDAP